MVIVETDSSNFFFDRVLTKMSKINVPGYISSEFINSEGKKVFERVVFLPEDFFLEMENSIIREYGNRGKNDLYCIGKKFGYRFALLFNFSGTDIKKSLSIILKFLEALYAEKITIKEINLNNKTIVIDTKEMVITSKNGHGYILPLGGFAGICSYLLKDNFIWCRSTKVADGIYELTSSPKTSVDKIEFDIDCEMDLERVDDNYEVYNSSNIKDDNQLNMQKLVEFGILTYEKGKLNMFSVFRMVPIEIFLLYSMEMLDENIIFQACYNTFYKISTFVVNKKIDPKTYIAQILTALGFGIVIVVVNKERLVFNFTGYPWMPEERGRKFSIIKGVIIGFINGGSGKKIDLDRVEYKLVDKDYLLTLEFVYVN